MVARVRYLKFVSKQNGASLYHFESCLLILFISSIALRPFSFSISGSTALGLLIVSLYLTASHEYCYRIPQLDICKGETKRISRAGDT